jgi:hypothetical protein
MRIKFVSSKRKGMKYPMKAYDFQTIFKFGKYKGKSLEEIVVLNVHYITWCIKNVDNFYVSMDTLNEINTITKLVIPDEINMILKQKELELENEEVEDDNDEYDNSYERKSCNENPWVDVFGEGEEAETAYWNTD